MRRIAAVLIFIIVPLWANQASDKVTLIDAYSFKFGIVIPENWKGVQQKIKDDYLLYMLYNKKSTPLKPGPVITIQTFPKIAGDMQDYLMGKIHDMQQKKQDTIVEEFDFFHPEYDSFSAVFYKEKQSYIYMTAIDPGASYRKGLLFYMSLPGREATQEEMGVFMNMVESLSLIEMK